MFNPLRIIFIMWVVIPSGFATCTILTSFGVKTSQFNDGISLLLTSEKMCPKDVFQFRELIKAAHLTIESTMVANRGYHNPKRGSFSLFEMVSGKLDSIMIEPGTFFFGHFTTVNQNNELTLDQGITSKTRLMIEAFAWDNKKEVFNFYELMGDGKHNQWFYRGDSSDIYADNVRLHRQQNPSKPEFGHKLRCSACHNAGGPIMKEVYPPHNDWWEPTRKLDFGGRRLHPSLFDIVANLVPAERLADKVKLGLKKLQSGQYLNGGHRLSLQETLRPLFCPVEINLVSDSKPFLEKNAILRIPIEFFIDRKLKPNELATIEIKRSAYQKALIATGSHFAETALLDADHGWLAPVKGLSDELAIDHLIERGIIDEKFAFDVLNIDMTNPIFSTKRCSLLNIVPNEWSFDWKNKFIQKLKTSNDIAALELLKELTNTSHTPNYHKEKAAYFLKQCVREFKSDANVQKLFLLLLQRREEIKASQISKNPLGQILEPGFRVIFPHSNFKPMPGEWRLTDTCEIKLSHSS